MFYVKYILFFILFFAIHYCEGLPPIGPISFAQFWKMLLLAILIMYNVVRARRKESFEKSTYLLGLESLFNAEIFINPLFCIVQAIKLLPFVIFYDFFSKYFINNVRFLQTVLYSVAQYICLSSIPVLLGIIEPLGGIVSADVFTDGARFYAGIFGSSHAASSYFVIAILVLMHGIKSGYFDRSISKYYNCALILVGAYSIFQTYVRTGWLMFIVCTILMLKPQKLSRKNLMAFGGVILVIFAGLVWFYNANEMFQIRVAGRHKYTNANAIGIDTHGSGRIAFWANGISNWTKNNTYELLFGTGYTDVVEDNRMSIGIGVISHNHFVDTLCQNGLIGLILLLSYFAGLYKFIIRSDRGSPYRQLALSLFWGGVIFAFFQNEINFNYAVIQSLILVLIRQPATKQDYEL